MKNYDDELARTLGVLSGTDAQSLQSYIDSAGSAEVSASVRAAADVLAQIGLSAPSATVRPDLKQRLRRRIEAQRRSGPDPAGRATGASDSPEADPGPEIIRAADDFEPIGVEGISVRRLHIDTEADQATLLVRMEPGSAYPAHRHAKNEICYVLEGELSVGEQKMAAGDFQFVAEGNVHPVQSTRTGCLFLITSSLNDEVLP